MRNVLIIQAILILAGVAVSKFYQGDDAMLPAFYGGGIALANTIMLVSRLKRASEAAKESAYHGVAVIAMGAVQRFVFVLVALGFGLQYLALLPVPLLGTFAVAQVAYWFAAEKQVTTNHADS